MNEETPETKLELVVAEQKLEPTTAAALMTSYRPFFDQAHSLVERASKIKVTDATQVTEIRESRQIRLELVKVRTAADKQRKAMKEESLRQGKAIDGAFNILKFMVEPIEELLLESEKFAERAEAARRAAIKEERIARLAPYGWQDTPGFDLEVMDDLAFEQLLENTISRFEAEKERKIKEEADRIAREKEEREEQARIRSENEALKLENERIEREKREAYEKAQKEREALEAKARAEREKAALEAKKAKAESDRLRKEAEDKARKEREEIERKNAAEREMAEKIAAAERKAAQEKQEAERAAREKAERELAEVRRKEEEAKEAAEKAARLAANAPDKEKLAAFAKAVTAAIPKLSKPERTKAVEEQVKYLVKWIEGKMEAMTK